MPAPPPGVTSRKTRKLWLYCWQCASQKGWYVADIDQRRWVPAPAFFREGHDRTWWAGFFADRLHGVDADLARAELIRIYDAIWGHVPCHDALLHAYDPDRSLLPVCIGIWQVAADWDTMWREFTRVDETGLIEPPVIEEFPSPHLGTGRKCLHYVKHKKTGLVVASLDYAFRCEELETDLTLHTHTSDLRRLQRALPDIDHLARIIKVVDHDQLIAGNAEIAARQDAPGEH